MTGSKIDGFRLGIYVVKDAEVVDFAGTPLTSVCTGSWILARAGLLDGLAATSRKEPGRSEARRRAGYDEAFIDDVARVMEYTKAYDAYRDDRGTATR